MTFGEVLAGAYRKGPPSRADEVREELLGVVPEVVPFTVETADSNARIRGSTDIVSPDAIHLACAASAGTDLFLRNDKEQKAIVDGLRDSLKDFEQGVEGVTPSAAMTMIMMARYFDALKEIGADSNTILLPHSPSAVQDLYNQLRATIISADLASKP